MKYRNRITLWAAVIVIGTVAAVSIIERSRAYSVADIISDEAAYDTIVEPPAPADTLPHASVDSIAVDSLASDTLVARTSPSDSLK